MANQNDETPLPRTDQELHPTHSFFWRCKEKHFNNMTCNKAGTVEESLKNSPQFAKTAEKNKEKELVIIRDGKAISSHFPCTLIKKGDQLTVKYAKAVERPKKPVGAYVSLCRNKPPSNLIMFHLLTKGGKNIARIMKNSALKEFQEISVYAYKGERVKAALKRDGRLHCSIFKKNFVLSNKSTSVKTELSNPVDELNDETFQIILLDKSDPPPSLPGSLDEAYLMSNEDQGQSEAEDNITVKQKPEANVEITPRNLVLEINNSKRTKNQLCFQFEEFVKGIKTQVPTLCHLQNLFRVDFGQSTQMCSEVKTMKRLMCLSDSVCQVRINGQPIGSGFLLFSNYVFTNGHVVEDIYDEKRCQFNERVSVHFSYESVEQSEGALDVLELVCFELNPEVHGGDWALLKLSAHQGLPPGLLKHIGFLPKDGGICIIGHPEGGVKKIDPCLIVPSQNRLQVVKRHCRENRGPVQFVTRSFFEGVAASVHQKSFLTYESCFYYASSGSPVFDKHCNVVAMHSGGYIYRSANGETKSVIEFAHPLLAIVERLVIQMVVREKFDALKGYLASSYAQHEIVMEGIKNLVEKENIIEFRNAVNNLLTVSNLNDVPLNKFLKFFSQKHEHIPMEVS
ncbi:protein FAM111A-like [Poecilia latipinna]|uniref:Protein FAM111A-like n=1 Tax=Poecilia latipinna TaxID=48699 RepID=A0A3B3TVG5_9TELE|nr:PREDICTED: protein FAM111A-like [Poecilia latipinna]XP_014876454.1 PREDICTED: protein FAM111A-like [Poecilia latipinna]